MARPQQITDDDIDQAARLVFLKQGPGAPIAAVAKRLGVSAAAVFQRVGSKEALIARALGPGVPETAAALLAGPVGPTSVQTLRRQLHGHLLSLQVFLNGALPRLATLRAAGLALQPRTVAGGQTPPLYMRRCLDAWLAQAPALGVARGNTSAVAEALLSALESRALHRFLGGAAFIDGDDDDAFIVRLVAGVVPATRPRVRREKSS